MGTILRVRREIAATPVETDIYFAASGYELRAGPETEDYRFQNAGGLATFPLSITRPRIALRCGFLAYEIEVILLYDERVPFLEACVKTK